MEKKFYRYFIATEEGSVVSWVNFIEYGTELIIQTSKQAELVLNICRMLSISCEHVSMEDYNGEPYWYIDNGKLCTSRYWRGYKDAKYSLNDVKTVDEYIINKTVGKLIDVTQEKWDSIGNDYKGTWQDYYDECPEWKGRNVVMSGCITEDTKELGKLLVEGIHFRIIGKGAERMKQFLKSLGTLAILIKRYFCRHSYKWKCAYSALHNSADKGNTHEMVYECTKCGKHIIL